MSSVDTVKKRGIMGVFLQTADEELHRQKCSTDRVTPLYSRYVKSHS